MYATLKLIVIVVITAGLLAGCGNDGSYNGKTAKEWAIEADQYKAEAKGRPSGQVNQQVKELEAEKKTAQRQGELKKDFLAKADQQASDIEFSRDGGLLVSSSTTALGRISVMGVLGDEEIVLGQADGVFVDRTLLTILPITSATFADVLSNEVVQEGRGKIRAAIISWAVNEPKGLDITWGALRPVLRQQYALLKSLRGYEPLFKTAYTRKGFEPLTECLSQYERWTGPSSDTKPEPTDKEIKHCNDVYKKWGLKPFDDANSVIARNALWIVRFLARREGDGGEKFVQKFQKLALDFIK